MRIARIRVWQLDLPMTEPYRMAGGRVLVDGLDSTLVAVDTDDGVTGWGEGCPWGHAYLPAHGAGIRAALGTLAPAVLGLNPMELDRLNAVMDLTLPGHPAAKSPLDIACWDILGQGAGQPLHRLLGGWDGAAIPINSSIPTGTPAEMIARIEAKRAQGYRVHSAKIGGVDNALNIARIEAIEAALAPGELVTFDINRAWTPSQAIAVMGAVQTRAWFEQPCEGLDQCAQVRARTTQPILLDESLQTLGDHLEAWRHRICEGAKIKPNRLGGLTRARQARDLCLAFGWPMHVEDLGGTSLADTAAIHLAASTPPDFRLASWLGQAHIASDPILGAPVRPSDGVTTPPDAPGLGAWPDLDRLGQPAAVYS